MVKMIGDGPPLVLDPKQVESARERIKTRYNVSAGTESRGTADRQARRRADETEKSACERVSASQLFASACRNRFALATAICASRQPTAAGRKQA